MASLPDSTSSIAAENRENRKVVINNVRIFDGQQVIGPRTVVIDGPLIGGDPEGAEEIDGQNGVLIPGLIDCHIHLRDEGDLQNMCAWGVTTGLGMAEWPPEKLHALRGRKGLTDIRSPGLPATSAGSIHSKLLPIPQEGLVAGPDDANNFVKERVAEGVDYIKVIADVPGPDQATLNALVSAAHRHGKLVIAHASAFKPFAMAQEAKADIVTHVPRDKPLDRESTECMLAEGRISVPTLVMMEGLMRPPSWTTIFRLLLQPSIFLAILSAKRKSPHGNVQKYDHARDSVAALYRAGVPILAGTDANSEPRSPFQVKHGEDFHRELELLVDAGMSTLDVMRGATSLPARYFGLVDRGAIEEGKRADLVLLSGDPIKDIRATRSIQRVWCGGLEYKGAIKCS